MRARLAALLVALCVLAACSAPSAPSSSSRTAQASTGAVSAGPAGKAGVADGSDHEGILAAPVTGTAVHCGYERWSVKTGTDPLASKVNLTPTPSSVAALLALKSPLPAYKGKYPPQTKRQPSEERTVTLSATLIRYTLEQDNDFHLVLSASGKTMIAEIPNPLCVKGGPFVAGITTARHAFIAQTGYNPAPPPPGAYSPSFVTCSIPVTVTGVVFFDWPHGQSGVAGNAVELHPVLNIAFAPPSG
jgi:hypothetical protein